MTAYSDEVLKVTQKYLGPSAKAFLERQTKSHLNGLDFNSVEKTNVAELTKWIEVSAGLLIGKEKAAELAHMVRKI
jgi:hypothetical protein